MGEKKQFQALNATDIISVIIYRTGIVVAMGTIFWGTMVTAYFVHEKTPPPYLHAELRSYVLIAFITAVTLSISLLHLYSKQVLNIIRSFAGLGLSIMTIRFLLFGVEIDSIVLSEGVAGKLGVAGWGFLMAAYSGIGAKEAFCFKLYEGYAIGVVSFILVLSHFFGILPFVWEYHLLSLVALLSVVFVARKLFLPLHYDIGDKSRY